MKFRPEDLMGKHILVGIVYRRNDGRVDRTVTNHGTIVAAEGGSVEYKVHGEDRTITVPYNPNFFEKGEEGAVYTLEGTGEYVKDVDVVASFEVREGRDGGVA